MHRFAFLFALAACGNDTKPSEDTTDETDSDTDADSDSDTDTDTDTDTDVTGTTGDTATVTTSTGDTGVTVPCDDAVERQIEVCWRPGNELLSTEDGTLMLRNMIDGPGPWNLFPGAAGPFRRLCADWTATTGDDLRVQAEYTADFSEVPPQYGGTWWAIANWDGLTVEAKGTWTIDEVQTPVTIVENDGKIRVPSCE